MLKVKGGVKFEVVVVMWVMQLLGNCGRVPVHTKEHGGEKTTADNITASKRRGHFSISVWIFRPAEAQNAMEGELLPRTSSLLFTQYTGVLLQSY